MKKEDLIIGDWVTRRGVPEEHMRICGMNVLAGVVYLDQDGRGVTEKFENIEPIPLTLKILEKKKWDAANKLKPLKTAGGHRRYRKEDLDKFVGINEEIVSNSMDLSSIPNDELLKEIKRRMKE